MHELELDAEKDWGERGKGGNKGWEGWMATLTQWILVWANFPVWTGKPDMVQFMGLQRVGHNLETEQQQQCIKVQNDFIFF